MYNQEQIAMAKNKIMELIAIVNSLEDTFAGRHFTLDGHLVGSIGEVMAAYYYGIKLFESSTPIHDGISPDGRNVQIKMTQGTTILISEEPEYLIVLHMNKKTGDITEIYNGPGKQPWQTAYHYKKHNNKYMRVNKLLEYDKLVVEQERIPKINEIQKFRKI